MKKDKSLRRKMTVTVTHSRLGGSPDNTQTKVVSTEDENGLPLLPYVFVEVKGKSILQSEPVKYLNKPVYVEHINDLSY